MGRTFEAEQRGVATGIAAAAVITVVALMWGGRLPVFLMPDMSAAGDRIAFALRCDLVLAVPLALCIGNVARLRFLSPDDIGAATVATPGRAVAIGNALLRNTAEQTLLAVIVHLGLAAVATARDVALVPVFVGLFCIGRLCFAVGYRHGAAARSFGFALTFVPSLAGLALGLFHLMR